MPRISFAVRLAILVIAVGGATALRLALIPFVAGVPYIFYFPAVVTVAAVAGARWGIAALGCSALLAWYFFISPAFSFRIENSHDAIGLIVFVISGAVVLTFPILLRRSIQRLRTSEMRYRQIASIAAASSWLTNAQDEIEEAQEVWERLTGMVWPSYRGRAWRTAIHPEDISLVERRGAAQIRIRTADANSYRWFAVNSEAFAQDDAIALMHTAVDIDELKRAQERQELLNAELRHRLKNLMAVIGGIANGSQHKADPAVRRFLDEFLGRIYAILRTGEAVLGTASREPSISEVAQLSLAPFLDKATRRIDISGIQITVTEQTAGGLALAFYELATNALKYGALSEPGGQVGLHWTGGAGAPVVIEWKETGGPRPQPPTHRGFGTRVIEIAVSRELNGSVEMLFEPDGLRCRMSFEQRQMRVA
jgi:PAS domain S-box-containing protein